MIKTNKGATTIEGTVSEILTDFTMVIRRVYATLTEDAGFSEEDAKDYIAKCGRMAFTPEDKIEAAADAIKGVVDKIVDKIGDLDEHADLADDAELEDSLREIVGKLKEVMGDDATEGEEK